MPYEIHKIMVSKIKFHSICISILLFLHNKVVFIKVSIKQTIPNKKIVDFTAIYMLNLTKIYFNQVCELLHKFPELIML